MANISRPSFWIKIIFFSSNEAGHIQKPHWTTIHIPSLYQEANCTTDLRTATRKSEITKPIATIKICPYTDTQKLTSRAHTLNKHTQNLFILQTKFEIIFKKPSQIDQVDISRLISRTQFQKRF